jgi:hypothetical protein
MKRLRSSELPTRHNSGGTPTMLGEVYTGGKMRKFEDANVCGFGATP